MELLAPAGEYAAFLAAIGAGADAIYLAGSRFGARAYAGNFSAADMEQAIRYAHLRRVRVYVTVNTLLADQEAAALIEYVQELQRIGADAVIVQDLGVAALVREHTNLPIHASTQMTVTDLAGVLQAQELGIRRVVLARELSLEDIQAICAASPLDIEVFGHGALCVSYSGQCLMSSMIGGRSGNRGRCAQPCRLPYQLAEAGKPPLQLTDCGEFLLSPKDLCSLRHVSDLLLAGVHSLKIEGRMKRPEYVAAVVASYRQAIDQLENGGVVDYEQLEKRMSQVFSRGFTDAYLAGQRGAAMLSHRRPNNRGLQVGRVQQWDPAGQRVAIQLEQPLQEGDILEVWTRIGGRATLQVQGLEVNGQVVPAAYKGQQIFLPLAAPVQKQDRVFKVYDSALTAELQPFMDKEEQKIGVDIRAEAFLGQPFRVALRDEAGHEGWGKSDKVVETALRHAVTRDMVVKQLDRLGETDFQRRSLEIALDQGVMVPVSEMNKARRQAVEALMEARLATFPPLRRSSVAVVSKLRDSQRRGKGRLPQLAVRVYNLAQAEGALSGGAERILYGGEHFAGCGAWDEEYIAVWKLCRERRAGLRLVLPRAVRQEHVTAIWAARKSWEQHLPEGIVAGGLGMMYLARQWGAVPVYGDFGLNVFNQHACEELARLGLAGCTASTELTLEQLRVMCQRTSMPIAALVHGKLPLMVLENCVVGSFVGLRDGETCSHPCARGRYELIDRKGERFPVLCDQFGRSHVLNARTLVMADHLGEFCEAGVAEVRIDMPDAAAEEVRKVTSLYRRGLQSGERVRLEEVAPPQTVTRGHYFRGTE